MVIQCFYLNAMNLYPQRCKILLCIKVIKAILKVLPSRLGRLDLVVHLGL